MGVDVEMRFTVKRKLSAEELRKLAWRLGGAFYREETFWFFDDQQAITLADEDDDSVPDRRAALYDVHLRGRYYGPDYERGQLETYIAVAEWLEANVPDCEVWYGGDCGATLERFDAAKRTELKAHFHAHGHAPYVGAFGGFLSPPVQTICTRCQEPMMESGGGGGTTFLFCYGCPEKAIVQRANGHVLRRWSDGVETFVMMDKLREEGVLV